MDRNQISEELYQRLLEFYNISAGKDRLPHPDEVKELPFLLMTEDLQKITDSMTVSDEKSNELFAQYYSVCLRGVNPFKESVLKKAGIDGKSWKRLLKLVSGDY